MQNKLSMLYRQKAGHDPVNVSGTIIGFVVLLTGGLLLFYALLDMVVRLQSLQTVCYLIVGAAFYKIGQSVLRHFATFNVVTERRRGPKR